MSLVRNVFSTILILALLWPLVYVFWMSFTPGEVLIPPTGEWSLRWYRFFWENPQWTDGLWHSLQVAGLTVVGSLLAGGGVALAVTRYNFRGKRLLSEVVLLPLYVPAIVLGMSLLPFMRTIGVWGTLFCLAIAHSLSSLPIVFLVIRSALEDFNLDLERAARGLGASVPTTVRRITLPAIASTLLVGGIIAFILSLNEFVLALFLCTVETETLPKVIWPNLRYTLTPVVAAASSITILLTLIGLALVIWLLRIDRIAKQI
jgi:ABC-type spermidine/putrescine transport system permease subunit II